MARVFPGGGSLTRSFRGGAWGVLVPALLLGALWVAVVRQAPAPTEAPGPAATTTFAPSFERLPLVPNGHYELWVERPDGGGERLAAFTASVGDALLDLAGEPLRAFPVNELPPAGSTILLTVEAGSSVAEVLGGRVLLRGTLSTTDVTLEPVLPSLAGEHVALLVSPTDVRAPATAGLWFARPAKTPGRFKPGLALPAVGGGWAYGGFVTTASGTTLRTGLFTNPGAGDQSAPFSGNGKGLALPGEDFVRNPPEGTKFPVQLADGRTRVLVSLLPDFLSEATEPFLPLVSSRVPYRQKTGEPFGLEAVSKETFPRGRGTFAQRSP